MCTSQNSLAKLQRVHASAVPKNACRAGIDVGATTNPSHHGGLGGGSPKKTPLYPPICRKTKSLKPSLEGCGVKLR